MSMTTKRSFLGGVALVGLGAVGAIAASHIKISWDHSAHAAALVAPAAEARAALPPPSASQVSAAKALSHTFAQVAAQLSPSVVRISIVKTIKNVQAFGNGNPFEGTPFEHFFGGGGGPPSVQKEHGTGSGVVIDTKGYILTNNHVVDGADEVKVTFADGKTVKGKVVGTDPKSDLAVVKVDGVKVKAAKLGDSDKIDVGDWVIAIGNPYGLDHTVTVGVLSAKNRTVMGNGQYEDFLQTDASINPGNSGGPLVDLDGEVIGINSMIRGIGTGIGFAIPTSMAKPIAEQLIQHGKVRRPYLGILMQDVTSQLAKSLGQSSGSAAPEQGALVSQVQPGSPAARAGLKEGDIITAIDGQKVDGSKAVQRTVLRDRIDQKMKISVWRNGKNQQITATTGELPGDGQVASAGGEHENPRAKLGIALQTVTPELAQRLGVARNTKGAVITAVRGGSPAEEAGLHEGDVVLEVDRRPVGSADDAARALTARRSSGHLVRVERGGGAIFLVIPPTA